jgi:cellulose synthase (UDP-forming)
VPFRVIGLDPVSMAAPPPSPARAEGGSAVWNVRDERVLSGVQRAQHLALGALWLFVVVSFWRWWLVPAHHGAPGLYVPATVALAYLTTVLPSLFWLFVGRMRRPVHVAPAPGRRVALVTLCVPSHETFEVISRQLLALTLVSYPHDSWVLDEGADEQVEALARGLGVRYFTRSGVARYNQPVPPFQGKTKAGNVNAWLDHIAAAGIDYEVFVQLDIDHRPRREYLERTLGYFDDPRVAWVQAPSVYADLDHWTARGLAEQDLLFHGPLQMGFYGHSHTPFIIGSHTSYRMAAIREIGGFQPTRAEDHLDTVVLAAAGYTGVYVPEVIARGDGPADFGTYLGQQFAWAYSMVQIFLRHTPRLVRRYTPAQALQFLMAQTWYLLWSLSLATLWALPIVALLSDRPIANVSLWVFLVYNLAVVLTSSLMWWWTRRWFQPAGIGLSWRGVVLEVARWPVVLWAVANVLLGIKRPYMITPKGKRADKPAPGRRLYGLYALLAAVGLCAADLSDVETPAGGTHGYLVLVVLNTLMLLTLLVTALSLELRDLRRSTGRLVAALRLRAWVLCGIAAILAVAGISLVLSWRLMGAGLRW